MDKRTKDLIIFIASGFSISKYVPAPGTVGSLMALIIYLFLPTNPTFYWVFLMSIIIFAGVVSHYAEKILQEEDASTIIIDDICGFFVCMAFLPKNILLIIIGFVLYRYFDVKKVYPIKKAEVISGGIGIILDDIMAGIFTNLILHILHWL